MISRFLLKFSDRETAREYHSDKRQFYAHTIPIMTIILLLVAVANEMASRLELTETPLQMHTSIVNWSAVILFTVLSILVQKVIWVHPIVCPLLTQYLFYHIMFNNYEDKMTSIIASSCIGLVSLFYLLLIFNEFWLLSAFSFTPGIFYFVYKNSLLLTESGDFVWVCILSGFQIFVYASVAYKLEN